MMGMNVSEGVVLQPRGTGVWDVRILWDVRSVHRSDIRGSQSPRFLSKNQAGACGGCPQHLGSCGRFPVSQCIPSIGKYGNPSPLPVSPLLAWL